MLGVELRCQLCLMWELTEIGSWLRYRLDLRYSHDEVRSWHVDPRGQARARRLPANWGTLTSRRPASCSSWSPSIFNLDRGIFTQT